MKYEPNEYERKQLFEEEKQTTVLIDLELMTGSKLYPMSDLDKPVDDPAIQYINRLKKLSFDSLLDIVTFEWKTMATLILDPVRATDRDREEIERLKNEIIKRARESFEAGNMFESSWAEVFFHQLVTLLPDRPDFKELVDGIYFTLLFSRDPNAWAINYDNRNILALDATLKPMLEFINGFLFLCKHKLVYGEEGFSFDWVSKHLLPVVLYFTADYPASKLPWIVAPSLAAARYNKVIVAQQIRFIIAHELGHLFMGHLGSGSRSHAIDSVDKTGVSEEVLVLERSHQQEFEADQFGINCGKSVIVTQVLLKKDGSDLHEVPVFRMAVELLFLIFAFIEQAGTILLRNDNAPVAAEHPASSHPCAQDRLSAIQKFHATDILNDNKTLVLADSIFSQWLQVLKDKNVTVEQLKKWLDK